MSRDVIHLPDLLFVQYCQETYGLNRGVYNRVDIWFYQQDVKNVIERRRYILDFLIFLLSSLDNDWERSRIKIGKGNLVHLLNQYWKKKDKSVS
ncbi:hypothetical protein ACE1TI_08445 [Alteribacillus sp. JSM 102045]|uniref:hypothetical protein n=1 Tax=Alteribacillus sp. JSM 102045 TaxID=1562101 RepID=UPI0035BF94C2